MSGQAHDGLAAAFAQNGWFSGLDGDAMEQKGAQRFNNPAGGVLHANAAAAGNDHQITAVLGCFYNLIKLLFLILQDAVILRLRPGGGEQSLEHGAVHIPDLAGAGLLLRRHQLIPGGEDAHPELLHHRHLNAADGGQGANVPVGEQAAFFQHRLAGVHIVPLKDHVLAGGGGLGDADAAVAIVLGILDHDHAVRPGRHGAAGGDGDAAIRLQGLIRPLAHQHLAGLGQDGGDGIGAAKGVPGPDGVAIHGGAVKGRHIFPGSHILCQHAANGGSQRNGLHTAGQGGKFFFYHCQNFFRRFHTEHVTPLG